MYNEERKAEIIKYLERDGKVSVADLAEKFQTSKETIRRDLKDLEANGVLNRTHGGAIPKKVQADISGTVIKEYPANVRKIQNAREKQLLCRKMASYIMNGDILYIDNSTTCLYIVENLPADLQVTIFTNSLQLLLDMAQYDCTHKTIFCLGGSFNPSNLSTYNNTLLPKDDLEFYPHKCIISCAGISPERGITDGSLYEVAAKRKFMEASSEVFLLVDHSKIGHDGQFFLDDGSSVDYLITDQPFDYEQYPNLAKAKVILPEE